MDVGPEGPGEQTEELWSGRRIRVGGLEGMLARIWECSASTKFATVEPRAPHIKFGDHSEKRYKLLHY